MHVCVCVFVHNCVVHLHLAKDGHALVRELERADAAAEMSGVELVKLVD